MNRSFKAQKKSLNMKENLKSWKKGTHRKMIAVPSNKIAQSTRGGLILT